MNKLLSAMRSCFARWFPGRWAAAIFGLPLACFLVYASISASCFYNLEIMLLATRPVELQVAFDAGAGFEPGNVVRVGVQGDEQWQKVRAAIPVRRVRSLRLSLAEVPATVHVASLTVRTKVRVWTRPTFRRPLDLPALRIEPPVEETLPGGIRVLRLEAAEGGPAAECMLTLPTPLPLGFSWWYFGFSMAGFASGWLFVWVALTELGRRFAWLRIRRERLSPGQAIWLVAAGSVVLSSYPVIFLGKSFASTNFSDGTFQLYDRFPTLPGSTDTQMENGQGTDLGPMAWHHGPNTVVQHRALFRDGELPLWNRYDEGGVALLGQGQSMLGDPLQLIAIAAGGRAWAWDVKYLLAKWLFAAGVGLLVLAATDCLPAALLLAFSSAFIGFFAYRLNHAAYFSLCYAPWILFAWVRIVRAPTWRQAMGWAGALIVANGMELTSGTAKEAFMLLAALNGCGGLMLLLGRLPLAEKRRRFLGLAGAGVIFCLLASPVLLAFFDTLRKSASGYDSPVALQLQPSLLVGLFDDIFYRQFNTNEAVLDPSLNGLVLLGVLLALGGARRLLADRIFAATALGTVPLLALVFGVVSPEVIRRVPFLGNIYHVDNTFSCPLLILCFVLAGFGLKHCLACSGRRWRRDALASLVAGGVLLGVYFGALQAEQRSDVGFQPAREIVFSPFFHWYVPTVLLAVLTLPLVLRRLRTYGPGLAPAVWLVCCLLLLHWRMGLQVHTRLSRYTPVLPNRMDLLARSPAVDLLRADRASPFRVIGIGHVFAHGYGAMMGLEAINGVEAIYNPLVDALDEAALNACGTRFTEVGHLETLAAQKPFHDLLGVRYFLTMPGAGMAAPPPNVTLAKTLDLEVYRNDAAWPRAFFVDRLAVYAGANDFGQMVVAGDGRPFAAVVEQEPGLPPGLAGRFSTEQAGRSVVPASGYRLTNHRTFFDVTAPTPGVVVLMEPFMAGDIVAELDGRPVPVWCVNHAFRGIVVDRPGTYRVMFSYAPQGFTLTLWAAALGAGLYAAAGWWLYRGAGAARRRSNESASGL